MTTPNALQIRLDDEIILERAVAYPMEAYVCTIAQPDGDGEAQVYVSNGSFDFRLLRSRRLGSGSRAHRVFARPLTIFSHPLATLDSVTLETFLVRDRRRARDVASVIEDMTGGQGSIADGLADGLAAVTAPTVGAVFRVATTVARILGTILRRLDNRLVIHDIGTQPIPQLLEDSREEQWGQRTGDRGHYSVHFEKVTLNRPGQTVIPAKLPANAAALLEAYLGQAPG